MLKHLRTARRNSCCCCAVCCIRVKHASSVYAPTANFDPLFPLFLGSHCWEEAACSYSTRMSPVVLENFKLACKSQIETGFRIS
uniref:Putative secreted protein n=1 Tax=Anopheles marajoara TaxID=58244 RepID=A0A2M4CC12_9DIPT